MTYAEIGQCLKVSKSSSSLWLREVPYVPTEQTLLKRRLASISSGQVLHRRKIKRITQIKTAAKKEISNIKLNEFKLLGAMAYWTEGSKTYDSLVKFTNSDPKFIRFALKWLRQVCKVPEEKLRMHLRVHSDVDKRKVELYWSNLTGIPLTRFQKTTLKVSGSNGKGYNKLSHGIASITVCDTKLFYRIAGWIEGLIENTKL